MLSGERIAVIGAGIAGCLVARGLVEKGATLEVFDKSRGTGGRLAAARLGELSADLGAPVLEEGVVRQLKQMQGDRPLPVQPWHHRRSGMIQESIAESCLWVSVPRASALTRSLLDDISLHTGTRITDVMLREGWWLKTDQGDLFGPYSRVVIAVPAPQAVALLAACPELQRSADQVVMSPSWVLLVDLEQRPKSMADIDLVQGVHPVLARLCRDSSKPCREGEVWQLTASTEWSSRHVDADPGWIAAQMLDAFSGLAGEALKTRDERVHRWLYADVVSSPIVTPVSSCRQIAVCGDWVCGQGVVAAVQSAEQLIRALEAGV